MLNALYSLKCIQLALATAGNMLPKLLQYFWGRSMLSEENELKLKLEHALFFHPPL